MTIIHRIIAPITLLIQLLLMLVSLASSCLSKITAEHEPQHSPQPSTVEQAPLAEAQEEERGSDPTTEAASSPLRIGAGCSLSDGLCEEIWQLDLESERQAPGAVQDVAENSLREIVSNSDGNRAGVVVWRYPAGSEVPLAFALGALGRVFASTDAMMAPRLLALVPDDNGASEAHADGLAPPCATVIVCEGGESAASPNDVRCEAHGIEASELLCVGDEQNTTEAYCFWCGDDDDAPGPAVTEVRAGGRLRSEMLASAR